MRGLGTFFIFFALFVLIVDIIFYGTVAWTTGLFVLFGLACRAGTVPKERR